MKTVYTFEGGDHPVKIEQSEAKHGRFRITYGKQVRADLNYAEAAREFGCCVFHSLACASLIDNEGD